MIDLTKAILPQAVKVGGSFYKIHTDFKYFIRLCQLLKDKQTPINALDFIYAGEIPPNRAEGIRAVCEFMQPPRLLPRRTGDEPTETVLDYELDADLIYSAFLENYGIDLIDTPLHWYKFQALLSGLHDTELNRVIGHRLWTNTTGRNDSYTKQQQKLYEAWRLPQKEDGDNDEALKAFEAQLKG